MRKGTHAQPTAALDHQSVSIMAGRGYIMVLK
jgi:hypothetical protein